MAVIICFDKKCAGPARSELLKRHCLWEFDEILRVVTRWSATVASGIEMNARTFKFDWYDAVFFHYLIGIWPWIIQTRSQDLHRIHVDVLGSCDRIIWPALHHRVIDTIFSQSNILNSDRIVFQKLHFQNNYSIMTWSNGLFCACGSPHTSARTAAHLVINFVLVRFYCYNFALPDWWFLILLIFPTLGRSSLSSIHSALGIVLQSHCRATRTRWYLRHTIFSSPFIYYSLNTFLHLPDSLQVWHWIKSTMFLATSGYLFISICMYVTVSAGISCPLMFPLPVCTCRPDARRQE